MHKISLRDLAAGNTTRGRGGYDVANGFLKAHGHRILQELRVLGTRDFDLQLPHTLSLPYFIGPNEVIGGAIYGHYKNSWVALVATDRRVYYIDKKYNWIRSGEINYDLINDVSQHFVGLEGNVTLASRTDIYSLKTYNQKSANIFCNFVESHLGSGKPLISPSTTSRRPKRSQL